MPSSKTGSMRMGLLEIPVISYGVMGQVFI
jgi:hypothetical protein